MYSVSAYIIYVLYNVTNYLDGKYYDFFFIEV